MTRNISWLLRSPLLEVGEFRCPTDDASWREANLIGDRAHVVFPRVPVVIRQAGRDPVLATANHTMLYDANRWYEREARSDRGDDCVFVELPGASLAALAGEGASLVGDDGRMRGTHAPTDRRTYLLQHLLVRHLRERPHDRLPAEDIAARLVLAALSVSSPALRPRRRSTAAAHRELAEAAKAEIAATPAARTTLDQLARKLHTSAFHLARVFRAETGFALAQLLPGAAAARRARAPARHPPRPELARARARVLQPQPLRGELPPRVRRPAVRPEGRPAGAGAARTRRVGVRSARGDADHGPDARAARGRRGAHLGAVAGRAPAAPRRAAARLTGARYAALGVIDPSGTEVERFVTHGIDAETHAAIGELPRGGGSSAC